MTDGRAGPARRAVFFDRDGVLNELVARDGMLASPQRIADFRLLPDAGTQVQRVRRRGFLVFVVTNQPDLARGLLSRHDLDLMMTRLRSAIELDDVMICPHEDRDECDCRKPRPGMLLTLAERWDADLGGSFVVGDSWKDVEAGKRAGCTTILIAGGEGGERTMDTARPDQVVDSLASAVNWILERAPQT